MENESCLTCRCSIPKKDGKLKCCRFPPVRASRIDNNQEYWGFPVVNKNDWCGEYKSQKQVKDSVPILTHERENPAPSFPYSA